MSLIFQYITIQGHVNPKTIAMMYKSARAPIMKIHMTHELRKIPNVYVTRDKRLQALRSFFSCIILEDEWSRYAEIIFSLP